MTANATDIARTVVDVIAETFGIDSSCVSRTTTAADVDGWDSLAHTVLMVRLEKRLGRPISEPQRVETTGSSASQGVSMAITLFDGGTNFRSISVAKASERATIASMQSRCSTRSGWPAPPTAPARNSPTAM